MLHGILYLVFYLHNILIPEAKIIDTGANFQRERKRSLKTFSKIFGPSYFSRKRGRRLKTLFTPGVEEISKYPKNWKK